MNKKSQKLNPTKYDLLIAQDVWYVHYQILMTILLKELIKLNANMDMIIKYTKRVKLNTQTTNMV